MNSALLASSKVSLIPDHCHGSMDIVVLGLNHKTAPVSIRERLNVAKGNEPVFLRSLSEREIFGERVILSTCNRTEIYGASRDVHRDIHKLKEFISDYARIKLSEFEKQLYVLTQPFSIRHLFSVTSGLNSMVVGETEIAGQVKDAYQLASAHGHTGKTLNRLFQRAFGVSKDVRSRTAIGEGKVSVASIAVDLVEKSFRSLDQLKVMILGTGKMSAQVVKAMKARGAVVVVVSRGVNERAHEAVLLLDARVISYDAFDGEIPTVDVLISATSAADILIGKKQVEAWMKRRGDRSLFLIDIAVPRNIAADVAVIDNVCLYNIDALQKIAVENRLLREGQVAASLELIQRKTRQYSQWLGKEFK